MNECRLEGFLKVIRAVEVDSLTSQGWVVVGSFQDTLIKTVQELENLVLGSHIYNSQINATNWQNPATGLLERVPVGKTVVYKQIPEAVTYFVLQKDDKSALAEVGQKLELTLKVLERERMGSDKKIAAVKTECDSATALLKKGLKETEEALKIATSGKETEALTKQIKKLEADLEMSKKDVENAKRDLETARQEHYGVRRVDLTEDVSP